MDLSQLITRYASDPRLKVYHHSLLLTLTAAVLATGGEGHISRSKLMEKTGISSTRTYHKYMQQLVSWGYLSYVPSYHPDLGTRVKLLTPKYKKTAQT